MWVGYGRKKTALAKLLSIATAGNPLLETSFSGTDSFCSAPLAPVMRVALTAGSLCALVQQQGQQNGAQQLGQRLTAALQLSIVSCSTLVSQPQAVAACGSTPTLNTDAFGAFSQS